MVLRDSRYVGQRVRTKESPGRPLGETLYAVSASTISSGQLKTFLDRKYPGQYSVQLKRDEFTISIKDEGKSLNIDDHNDPGMRWKELK
ncbi:hypothetical protein F4821DRAFT_115967 [Hypoxylon rubiginosum]|uniref:Uncharacterized protein n=1 Tax=Hypoxylon rubiginosum TaxID=110542 RepID=A0ACC0D3L8_9PEZI|nr:hypothetical protein F4821DRAFT_115967 [Hypoxylon rubiginosum]